MKLITISVKNGKHEKMDNGEIIRYHQHGQPDNVYWEFELENRPPVRIFCDNIEWWNTTGNHKIWLKDKED